MKVTITAYRELAKDSNGNPLPIGGTKLSTQKLTADGTAAAMPTDARFVRVATDTAIHFDSLGAGAADTDEMLPAGAVEFFETCPGATPSVLTA